MEQQADIMQDQNNNNYRIIILANDNNINKTILSETKCVLKIGDHIRETTLPFQEAVVFDLESINPSEPIQIFLDQGGSPYAAAQIVIPLAITTSAEIERTQILEFSHLDDRTKGHQPIKISFLVLYLNRTMYAIRRTAARATESNRKVIPPSTIRRGHHHHSSSTSFPTSAHGEINRTLGSTRVSPFKGKNPNQREESFNVSIDKIIDKHLEEVRLVEDNQGIEDCMYLSNFHSMIATAPEQDHSSSRFDNANTSLHLQSQVHLSTRELEVPEPQTLSVSLHEYEMSPQKLRERFESPPKEQRKPQTTTTLKKTQVKKAHKPASDLTFMMYDADARRVKHEEKNQVEYLKMVIYALDLKLQAQEEQAHDVETLKQDLAKAEHTILSLRSTIDEASSSLHNEFDLLTKQQGNLINEREAQNEKIKELIHKNKDLTIALEKERQARSKIELENSEAVTKMRLVQELRTQLEAARSEVKLSEKSRAELQNEIQKKFNDLGKNLETHRERNKALHEENMKLQAIINDLNHQLTCERTANAGHEAEIENLRVALENRTADTLLITDLQKQRESLTNQLAQAQILHVNIEKILDEYRTDLNNKIRQNEAASKKHVEEFTILHKKNETLNTKNSELNLQVNRLQKELAAQKGIVTKLEHRYGAGGSRDEAGGKQGDILKEKLLETLNDKQKLCKQMELVTEQIIGQEEKSYEQQKLVIYLKGVITEKEEYIQNLKKLIVEMKEKSAIYIPIRDDPVDARLADYLNTTHDQNKLKILFIRESDGVYQFGSKRIYVKVEGDRIMIRVGGGFLSIDDFLDKHVPLELERMSRNSPAKVLTNNYAVHKTISGRAVNEFDKTKTIQHVPKFI